MTLHGLFEQKAADHPEKTAVVYEGQKLSYRELNEQSNRLARALRRRGIGPDAPAAIVMERSERVITAMLGVLKPAELMYRSIPDFRKKEFALCWRIQRSKWLSQTAG